MCGGNKSDCVDHGNRAIVNVVMLRDMNMPGGLLCINPHGGMVINWGKLCLFFITRQILELSSVDHGYADNVGLLPV